MNSSILAAFGALALAGTITLSAQTPAATPAPPAWPQATAPAEPRQQPAMGTMTVTGCLKTSDGPMGGDRGAAATTPGAATPGAMKADVHYMLTDVTVDGQMQGGAMGTPAPGAPAHAMITNYMVVGASGVDLSAHVGHKVSITGTAADAHPAMGTRPMAKSADMPMGTPEMPATRPGDAPRPSTLGMDQMGAHKGARMLTASSITMISATCTATQ